MDLTDQLSSLAAEGFDLAIRHTTTPPDTHVAWALCSTHSVLVASPAYIKNSGSPGAPDELARHACLHYPRRQNTVTWTFERHSAESAQLDRVIVPVKGQFAVNNSEALRDAALAGLGITLLPDFTAQSALKAGTLLRVLPGWNPVAVFGEKLYAIRPYSSHVPRAVRALVAYLRETFKDGFAA